MNQIKRIWQRTIPGMLVVAVTACASVPQHIETPDVFEQTLDNGLRVLVKPDHRAPVVVSQIWYKVGGSYEPKGLTGISHVLEHMMFKGTERLKPNEFSRIIAENGGRENAFTGQDYTAYFQRLEKSRLYLSFELEADRMQNLRLSDEEFKKEIEVVKEERRLRTEDKPEARTYEKFMAAAFTRSNSRNPIIGWPDDLAEMNVEKLKRWYSSFYAPNNATVVVAGDVEPEEVFALARKYFGKVPRRPTLSTGNPEEPPQNAERRIVVKAPARVPYMIMGYHVPMVRPDRLNDWEPYALDVLAYLMDGGKSARFNRELIREQQVASSIDVGYDSTSRSGTLFTLDANPAQGRSITELENAVRSQITRFQSELVSPEELERVKVQIVANRTYERDSIFYQAMKLGGLVTVGLPWQLDREVVARLRAVTPEQVREVARKYLVDRNLTVAVMEPTAIKTSSGGVARQ